MDQIIWNLVEWRGHLALGVGALVAYVAIRCLLAARKSEGKARSRLIACGLGSLVLAPLATTPSLGALPIMVAGGLVFLAATGVRRSRFVGGSLTSVGLLLLVVPTGLLASGNVLGLGSGPSMWPTTGKGFSFILLRPGDNNLGVGSQIYFSVPLQESGKDPDTEWPAGRYHKRVIGMPGDHVVIDDYTISVNGTLVANCEPTPTTQHLAHETWLCEGIFEREEGDIPYRLTWGNPEIWMDGHVEWHLGPEEVLVFGDNMVESGDSRHRGPIPRHWVVGLVR